MFPVKCVGQLNGTMLTRCKSREVRARYLAFIRRWAGDAIAESVRNNTVTYFRLRADAKRREAAKLQKVNPHDWRSYWER